MLHEGYFVQHNIKFRPNSDHPDFVKNQDSNHSDIDVLGFHPLKTGHDRVLAISCKSWQSGFDPRAEVAGIAGGSNGRGRARWKSFRELVSPKWSCAFISAVEQATGTRKFVYITAVTRLVGDKHIWEQNPDFKASIEGNPIRVLQLSEMLDAVSAKLGTTMANTSIGRFLQILKAARLGSLQNER